MKPFQFKYFTLYQEHAAMKVSTDSLILSGFVHKHVQEAHHILDIGSGSGVLAFLLAQKFTHAQIDGVEIDAHALKDALKTLDQPFFHNKQIKFHHADISSYNSTTRFDLIVSNPPYFIDSTKNDNPLETQARHTDSLHPVALFQAIKTHLQENGTAWVIYPIEFEMPFEQAASEQQLFIQKSIIVNGKKEKPVRKVTCFVHEHPQNLVSTSFLIRSEDGSYTDEYKTLTKEFHNKSL